MPVPQRTAAMLKTDAAVPEEQHFILSTLSPSPAQKRLALAVVLGILVVFALITVGPLKGVQLGRVDAFVPAYATAMFVCDSITAILLYAQFSILRSRAILVIASGYLFTALILIPWILVFPGVFAPSGPDGRHAEYVMALLLPALRLSPVRHRLCLLEGCGSQQAILAGHGACGDRPECRLDGGPRLGGGISLHSGRSAIAARDARFHSVFSPLWPYCWGARRVAKYFRPRRALDPATLGARSLVDGRDVPVLR